MSALLLSLAAATWISCVDLVGASLDERWLGWTSRELLEAAVAVGIRGVAIAGIAWVFVIVATRGRSDSAQRLLPLAVGLAAAMSWCLVSVLGSGSLRGSDALFGGVWIVAVLGFVGLTDRLGISRGRAGVLATGAAVGGVSGLHFFTAFAPLAGASVAILAGAAVWTVFVVGCGLLWMWHSPRTTVALAACILVGVMLPATSDRLAGLPGGDSARVGPSMILITADALRAGSMRLYGGPVETPVLERLAREGALFERAYSLSPWTMPSIAGIFSSRFPPGVTPGATPKQVAEESVLHGRLGRYWLEGAGGSLFARLESRGYATGALIGNYVITNHTWLLDDAGLVVSARYDETQRYGPFRSQPRLQAALTRIWPSLSERRAIDTTRMLTEHALAFVRENRDRSFFLWLHYYDPHSPLDPPDRFRTLEGSFRVFPPAVDKSKTLTQRIEEATRELAYIQSLYDAEIRYLDESVGELTTTLRSLDLDDSTYVVFTSDHGEEFMEHTSLIGHGHTFFEEVVSVPLIMHGPRIEPSVVSEPISAIDVLPTVEDLLGEARSPKADGASLAALLTGGTDAPPAPRPVFMQTNSTFVFTESMRAIVRGRYKLIESQVSGTFQLYDLEADPDELDDLSATHPERVAELSALLKEWSESFPGSYSRMNAYLEIDPEAEDFEAEIEQLKTLGYLE